MSDDPTIRCTERASTLAEAFSQAQKTFERFLGSAPFELHVVDAHPWWGHLDGSVTLWECEFEARNVTP